MGGPVGSPRSPHPYLPTGGWWRPRRDYGGGGGGYGSGEGCGCGCLLLLLLIMLIIVAVILVNAASLGGGSTVTASTVQRQKLPAGAVVETDYYTDKLGWINNQTKLLAGMKNFYQKTGVQPYLYLTDTINGSHQPTNAMVEEFAYAVYDGLFTDEAHFLLIFFEYQDQYTTWYLSGNQAKTVMDAEATDILLDYVDRYYYYDDLTDEEMFSKAFNDAGERIMQVTKSPWIPALTVIGILLMLIIAFIWWNRHKKQKNLEAEQTEKILNTPLDTFSGSEAEKLADKYKDQ